MIFYDMQSLLPPVAGGAVLGLAAMMMLSYTGHVMGFSGITKGLYNMCPEPVWRVLFLLGIVISSVIVRMSFPVLQEPLSNPDLLLRLVFGGVLIGLGTGFSNGCTSGHGIIGFARFSYRSIAATCVFLSAAIITGTLGHLSEVFPAGQDPVTMQPQISLLLIAASSLLGTTVLSYVNKNVTYSKTGSVLFGMAAGLALHISGMTKASKIAAFLDLNGIKQGTWDFRLLMVMAGAHAVCIPFYHLLIKKAYNNGEGKALSGDKFKLVCATAPIDAKLVLGALTFGVGWGIAAVCPGPAHTMVFAATDSVSALNIIAFQISMGLGWLIQQYSTDKQSFNFGWLMTRKSAPATVGHL